MTDAIEVSRRLYFAVDGINQVLRSIDPNWQVLYDLTLKKVEVLKDRKFQQGFDFSLCKNLNEWSEKEHSLFEYFGALITEIVNDQHKDLNEERFDPIGDHIRKTMRNSIRKSLGLDEE